MVNTTRQALSGRCVAVAILVFAAAQAALGQPADKKAESVKVFVGKSAVVESPWPAKRVAVTDPKIADVQVLTPRQVLLQGKKSGSTDLVMWSQDEQARTLQVSVTVDLEALRTDMKALFPDAVLRFQEAGDAVVASGSFSRAEQVQQMQEYFKNRDLKLTNMTDLAGVQQVMLQVRVAEVSRQAIRSLGVNFLQTGNDAFVGSQIGTSSGGPMNPMSIGVPAGAAAKHGLPFQFTSAATVSPSVTVFGGVPDWDLQVFLQALAENQYLRVLAEPNLIALSGQEASFLAGGEFPIPVVQGTMGGGPGGSSITIEYREYGIRLRFRPTVLGDGKIRLYVAPEVSELTEVGAVTIEGFQVPALITRKAATTVELSSRQSFAIAGLISRTAGARNTRVPGLGDVPVMGSLFRSVRYNAGETELVVLVTASLVEPTSSDKRPALPGDGHAEPSDWELYALGCLESQTPAKLASSDGQALQRQSIDKLKGAGAWATYDRPAGVNKAGNKASPAPAAPATRPASRPANP